MSNTSQKSIDLTAKPLTTISGHENYISNIAYLPGGKRVVSCSDDKTVRIWNVENGEQEGSSMEHEDRVYGLAVTRDGKRILSGSEDKKIKVWDVETHELLAEWGNHTGGILSISLSPDDRLAAIGDTNGKIVIRETREGGEVKYSIEAGSLVTSVYSLRFSPNGEKLACALNKYGDGGGDYAIKVFDVESGRLVLGPIQGHNDWIRCVLWSLDGSKLFSASDDHTIRCWHSETAESIGEPWIGHTDYVNSLTLSPDGTILASASSDNTVCFWDAHSGGPIEKPLQHRDSLWVVAFSPSGEFVASGNEEISIWRVPGTMTVKNR
ncbi:WD40 repeat-like protein [Paxillus ammoniavirescens]|nr:WD40 repeat-like protein [Paxillus ammoniavirescens]